MNTSLKANGDNRHGVLVESAFTRIPRWTRAPAPGTAEHETALPDRVLVTLRRLADWLQVPLSSMLLTAHAKVLAALSGESEVTTGYVPARGGAPLRCRLATASGSWRALLLDVHRAEAEVLARQDLPTGAPGQEPADESPETVCDMADDDHRPGNPVLRVALSPAVYCDCGTGRMRSTRNAPRESVATTSQR